MMIRKQFSLLFLCSILSFIIWSCEKTHKIPVYQISGIVKDFASEDSVLLGKINDIKRSGDKIYMVDDRSTIYLFDSTFKLLKYRSIEGLGPGEVGRGQAIQTFEQGFMVFDSMNKKFVSFNESLEFIREFQANELDPFQGFNFLIKNSGIYTAYNSTDALINRYNIDSDEHHRSNVVMMTKIGNDLSFYEHNLRSQSRDNLYGIHKYNENILLVNRFKPLILLLSNESGAYELIDQYGFEDVDYFNDVIKSNEDFHKSKENIYSWKTLVTDAEVYKDKLILLLNIEERGYEFFSHILIIDLKSNSFIPKQIYQLGLEAKEMPWVRKFMITKEGKLLSVVAGQTGFVSFDINLNE